MNYVIALYQETLNIANRDSFAKSIIEADSSLKYETLAQCIASKQDSIYGKYVELAKEINEATEAIQDKKLKHYITQETDTTLSDYAEILKREFQSI